MIDYNSVWCHKWHINCNGWAIFIQKINLKEMFCLSSSIRRCYEFLDVLLQDWQTHTLERWVQTVKNHWCYNGNKETVIVFCKILHAQYVSLNTWYCVYLFLPWLTPPPIFVTFNLWNVCYLSKLGWMGSWWFFCGLNWWAKDVWQPCVPAVSMAIEPRALL